MFLSAHALNGLCRISSGAFDRFEFSIDRDMLKVGRNELVFSKQFARRPLGLHHPRVQGAFGISGSVVMHGYRTSTIVDARVELSTIAAGDLLRRGWSAGMACEWVIDRGGGSSLRTLRLGSGESLCVFTRRRRRGRILILRCTVSLRV